MIRRRVYSVRSFSSRTNECIASGLHVLCTSDYDNLHALDDRPVAE